MPPLLACGLFDFVVVPPFVVVDDLPLLVLADVVDDVVVAERDVSSLREVSVASVVVVAEASLEGLMMCCLCCRRRLCLSLSH